MPNETSQAPDAPEHIAPASHKMSHSKEKNGGATNIIAIIVVVVIALAAWMLLSQNKLSGYSKEWQAIFLTNGQVYFGQIQSTNKAEIVAQDIYYLQVTRPLQQTEEGQEQASEGQGELSLVKLGNELHGPTDNMYINRDHVLFIEDLKDDSNVVQAIDNYKTGQ